MAADLHLQGPRAPIPHHQEREAVVGQIERAILPVLLVLEHDEPKPTALRRIGGQLREYAIDVAEHVAVLAAEEPRDGSPTGRDGA
jgi:hypothetical protein